MGVAGAVEKLGEYWTKATWRPTPESVSWELTHSQGKTRVRGSGMTFWDLLNEFAKTGDADVLDLIHEYERETKGMHALDWSKGLRELLGLGPGKTDEELAAEELGHKEDTVFYLTSRGFRRLTKLPGGPAGLLRTVEEDGWKAGIEYCLEHGIEIQEVKV